MTGVQTCALPIFRGLEAAAKHAADLESFLNDAVGQVFEQVLEDCGVFKADDKEAFLKFVEKAIY